MIPTNHTHETSETTWESIESRMDKNPFGPDFNTAHEICTRYANNTGMLAISVVHENLSVERWTFSELDRQASKAARMFAQAGLQPGDRVAGLLSRQIESWITALAAWRSGLVYVPLFGGFAPHAIGTRLESAHAKAVVVDHKYRAALVSAQTTFDLDLTVYVVGDAGSSTQVDDVSFHQSLDEASADGPIRPTTRHDAATLLFTSGTSGTPKACEMPHAAFMSVLPYAANTFGTSRQSTIFSTADPAWAFGLYSTGAAVMALGIPRVMYSGPFVAEAWHRIIETEHVTALATAPAALRRLAPVFRSRGVPGHLRTVAAAGEPLTAALAQEWAETGAPSIRNGYGLSEVGMLLGDPIGAETLMRPGMLASVIPGFDVFLADRDGIPVDSGEPGMVAVRRPRHQMSRGYENAPDLWSQRWRGDVFLTEDLAVVDSDGRWRVLGRDDDMMVISGHNISPVEVENALLQHTAVTDAAAVSFADPTRGDVIRVVVVRHDASTDADADFAEQLKALVADRVGRFATPRIVDFVSELPRTEVGKLRRAALRNSAVEAAR
ncbi:acetyl-CoA synthetase [Rhodococcus sp. 27YEA15]|uniref:AMP-binding protein n=1 Tax=Rhodococcus sp. 27YEA15 TaxID=3156259 RepID=UPI003C7C6E18